MFTKADIERYFMAEKQESLLFLLVGIAAVLLASWFYFSHKTDWYRGAALPLLVVGIIQLAVGYTVYKRSDGDRVRLVYAYDMDPAKLKNEELPRMKAVNRNFIIYRWTEIVLLLAGIALFVLFRQNPARLWWTGLGVTLAIQAALMLAADAVAEKRANGYTRGLEEFARKTTAAGEQKP